MGIPPHATPWVEWDAIWDACQNQLVPGGAAYYCTTSENVVGTSEWLASHADLRADGEVDTDIRRRILGCPQHRAVLSAAAWAARTYDFPGGEPQQPQPQQPQPQQPEPEPEADALARTYTPRTAALHAKIEKMRSAIEAHADQQKTAAGGTSAERVVRVKRDDFLMSLIDSSSGISKVRCFDELSIEFIGEEGVDDGGVRRDFFTTAMHAFVGLGRYEEDFMAKQLFTHTEDNGYAYRVNPASVVLGPDCDTLFAAFGALLGRGLLDGVLLDVHFDQSFYKALLSSDGKPELPFKDLESCDKKLYDSLRMILTTDPDDVEDMLCYTFAIDDEANVDGGTRELKPGGGEIAVTGENRQEFVKLWANWVMHGRVVSLPPSPPPRFLRKQQPI